MCLLLLNASVKEFSYFLSADSSIFLCVGFYQNLDLSLQLICFIRAHVLQHLNGFI